MSRSYNTPNRTDPPVTNDLLWIALFSALGAVSVLLYAWSDPVWGPALSEVAADLFRICFGAIITGAILTVAYEAIQ